MDISMMEVAFSKYCITCKHGHLDESEEPCFTCLEIKERYGTKKPEMYEKREK